MENHRPGDIFGQSISGDNAGSTIYLYIDEAGDFDFTEKGSKYYLLTCIMLSRPFRCADALNALRLDLLEDGKSVESFHASNDRKWLRDKVFSILQSHSEEFKICYAASEKQAVDSTSSTPGDIYCTLFDQLAHVIGSACRLESFSKVVAITDHLPTEVRKKQYEHRLRELLGSKAETAFTLAHHHSMSDFNLQIADYCCWAIQRYLERGDKMSKEMLSGAILSAMETHIVDLPTE